MAIPLKLNQKLTKWSQLLVLTNSIVTFEWENLMPKPAYDAVISIAIEHRGG